MHKYPLLGWRCQAANAGGTNHRGQRGFLCVSLCPSVPPVVKNLLPHSARRDLEVHAMVVIGFACGCETEVGEQNLVGAASAEVKQSIADDAVGAHVRRMASVGNAHRRT